MGCGADVGLTTREEALGKAGVEDKYRSSGVARIAAGAKGAIDGNFNIVTAIQSAIQPHFSPHIFCPANSLAHGGKGVVGAKGSVGRMPLLLLLLPLFLVHSPIRFQVSGVQAL